MSPIIRSPLFRNWRRAISCILICATSAFIASVAAEEIRPDLSQTIFHELECFRQMGSVLYIGAHPDDENTELLAYLARGRNYRTAYLSLTRGDGGQNVLSPDLGEKLGVARTQELLAARRIDGAQQFFSRAIDFGYSKSYEETLNVWNKEEVLSDIVRIIRQFRPDVVITRFSPLPGGTHGHHTASTVLALEAFKLAGDAKAFPEQKLAPWQPKRIFWNISTFQADKAKDVIALKVNVGGKDAVSGESFENLAQLSRSMHKTQGFDKFQFPGAHGGERVQSFQLLDGPVAKQDILDDVDTTWSRVPEGTEIGKSIDEIIAHFNKEDPAASVPALLKLRTKLSELQTGDPVVKEKRAQLDRILQMCLGLKVQTTVAQFDIVPGESIKLHHSAVVSSDIPVRWVAVKYVDLKKKVAKSIHLRANEASEWDSTETLPTATKLTQPLWLRAESTPGMFRIDDPDLIGVAEDASSFPIEDVFEVGGQKLVVDDQPVQIVVDKSGKEVSRRLDVIPPISLRFLSEVVLMKPNTSSEVQLEMSASRANSKVSLQLETPAGWKITPLRQSAELTKVGDVARFKFAIMSPPQPANCKIIAHAGVDGVRYSNGREQINYAHIPPQIIQSLATMKVVSLNLATLGKTVGYLPGAGDSLDESLRQMGYSVKVLDDASLSSGQLVGLDAVVIGARAYNERKNISAALPVLFDYVKGGGTVIAQYNRSDALKTEKIAPYAIRLSRDRITDEKSPVTFLAPENPVLNKPNQITKADFDGWVQERGLYFPDKWDEHFTPILAFSDPNEAPQKGGLLVAQYGKGYFIYTGLSFFRQLPDGVSGAYRLFANLVSIGK